MGDNAQVNGRIQPPAPAAVSGGAPPESAGDQDDQFDAAEALLRLLVGGVLVGADELQDRLERWQEAATYSAAQATPLQAASDSLRYMFVGMLFETEMRMRRRFSRLRESLSYLADEANLFYTTRTPAMRRTPFEPIRMRLDELLFLTMTAVDRWTDRGWIEEQRGRRMARLAATDVIDELLDYMAHNPEVRKLIEQQGLDMAESAVDEVRGRTASADQWIERLARSLLRRPVNDKPTKPTSSSATLPPATPAQTSPAATPTATKAVTPDPDAQGPEAHTPAAAAQVEASPLGIPNE